MMMRIWILGRQINLATNEDDEDDKFEDDEDDEDTWSASESRNWAVFRQHLDSTVGAQPVLLSGDDDDQPWCP